MDRANRAPALLAATAAIAVLAACTGVPLPLPRPANGSNAEAGPQPTGDRVVDAFIERADAYRRGRGCRPMIVVPAASAVAAAHSADMERRGYFRHESPEGVTPFDRLRAAGIRFRAAAENLAYGQRTGNEAFNAWMRSPGHRTNLEDCEFTHHGIGRSGLHWTHVFYRPN